MDELLILAFEEEAKIGYKNRVESLPKHKFSLKFYRKMHKLFQLPGIWEKRGNEKSEGSILDLYRPIRSKRRFVAIVLLLLMLIGGSSLASAPFIRWLSNFYIEQSDDHVMLKNDEKNMGVGSRNDFRKYSFVDIPGEYTLVSEEFDKKFQKYYVMYANSEGKVLSLNQVWQENGAPQNLTSDTEPVKDTEINGFTGYYVEDNGMGTLIISNGTYKVVIGGTFTKEKLIDLAGKLELSDEPIE